MTEELIVKEQPVFISGKKCINQIFTLKQMGENMKEKKKLCLSFINLQQSHDKIYGEALWQVLIIMYGVSGSFRMESKVKY